MSFSTARFLLLTVPIALGGCASRLPPPPQQLPPDDYLIVPGLRIGPVAIGMTGKQVLQAKGKPEDSAARLAHAAIYNYRYNYMVAVDDDTQQVSGVSTISDWYNTAEGVKIGQDTLEMRAKLGAPDGSSNVGTQSLPTYLYCYDKGLAVYVLQDRIKKLSVFMPGGDCK